MLTNMCCGLLGANPSVALGDQALSIMREDSSCVWEAQRSARAELEGVRPPETVIQIAICHLAGHSRAPELARYKYSKVLPCALMTPYKMWGQS